MKKCIYSISIALLISISSFSQTAKVLPTAEASDISAKIENNILFINWSSTETLKDWEVQGSTDGKSFSTIGMVMGQEPGMTKSDFKFKQSILKLKPGLKFYRVLHLETPELAVSSSIISVIK